MVKPTRNLDDLIRDALAAEDAEVLEGLEDQSAFELLVEVFRGRNRLFAAVGVVANIALFVIGVGAAIAFANAEDVRTMLLYAAASALSFAVVLAVKIWYWLEMTRLALTREVKRVELQVVQLSRRMHDPEGQ
jgi:predicted transcriptional regulator